jgi:signal peptidase I
MGEKGSFEEGIFNAFPFDSIMGWNIRDFGPLYLPRKGDEAPMNRTNYLLYRKPIE